MLGELRDLFSEEIIQLQAFYLTGDQETLARYRQVRAREELLFREFESVAREEGARALEYDRRLHELSGRWHELPDAWLAGRMSNAEFLEQLPRMLPVRDSLLALSTAAERVIENQVTAFEAAGVRIAVTQLGLALMLGTLGLIATIIVARAAMRERKLTRELALAVDQESRARQLADQRRAELETVSESKARLTRGFSHDVKNPLGAVDGYLALLEQGIPDPPTDSQRTFIEKARGSVAAALNLIEDLLEIERASTGNIRVERKPTDLREVVRQAADEYRVQAEAKGLDLVVDLSAVVPVIPTDRIRVRQVLGNLISNAVKYTPAGTISVRMDQRVDAERPEAGEGIAIEVSDTGIGIPPEKRHLVFQEFTRFEPGAAKGTGIGLAISHRIVQALGGELRLDSPPGRGSRFTLWIPL
ncbi:MAG TPA: HAMP domain-containing sensor histidine kinase [Gemmatimonadales bacterium]|nr:HAMP domain-containing sensor histidine kinase [Gemmatimonadales bacterium]